MNPRSTTSSPSSSTSGFFQTPPPLEQTFDSDTSFHRIFKFYLPKSLQTTLTPDLTRFSALAISPKILSHCADAERNIPYLRTYDSWGRRIDDLVTTSGWRELQSRGIAEGVVAIAHEREYERYSRIYQFLKYHMWTPSCAITTCPAAMTDGAARLLFLKLRDGDVEGVERGIFQAAYDHLVSRKEGVAWTSGQWMTERPGGSDVQNTETVATSCSGGGEYTDVDGNPLGPYEISGFKWFSSATDANATVLLAKEAGSGVVSAFFAPTRKRKVGDDGDGDLNGITIQRLKSKLGTRALPTAELGLNGMRAWKIGKTGEGTKEISTVLNITRVHNAVSAMGFWGRGLAISRSFATVREARGRLLQDTPAHMRTLAEQHVEYRAMMHLAFYTVALLGKSENDEKMASEPTSSRCEESVPVSRDAVPHLLRLLTPLAKMLTAKAAIAGLQECMESLGGVGYLENEDIALNIARLYRDVNVLSIWEGTTNIMADDLVRIVKGKSGDSVLSALDSVLLPVLEKWKRLDRDHWAQSLETTWRQLQSSMQKRSKDDLTIDGRDLGRDLGWVICAMLLGEDALSDDDQASNEICSRWIAKRCAKSDWSTESWTEKARRDRLIVFGMESKSKL